MTSLLQGSINIIWTKSLSLTFCLSVFDLFYFLYLLNSIPSRDWLAQMGEGSLHNILLQQARDWLMRQDILSCVWINKRNLYLTLNLRKMQKRSPNLQMKKLLSCQIPIWEKGICSQKNWSFRIWLMRRNTLLHNYINLLQYQLYSLTYGGAQGVDW